MEDIIGFLASGAGIIFAIAIPLLVIVISIILLLAINQLHKLPAMQESLENCEKYLKYLAGEKKKADTESKEN
ncbi:MAG: hypothetical protein LBH71_00095 [Oscillospiraceae bacterium]|jgi:cytochrome oxidase assembly protein ShyY1|nr:hypothetical protein [Oscillospiraceae bacterium]